MDHPLKEPVQPPARRINVIAILKEVFTEFHVREERAVQCDS